MQSQEPIIIIDDDTDDHAIFQEISQRLNLTNELLFFRNGTEVLPYLRTTTQKPFIIFCDINMPVMDGLQLRKQINDEEFLRKKSIPFFFLQQRQAHNRFRQRMTSQFRVFLLKNRVS